jgi:hypothetical protein
MSYLEEKTIPVDLRAAGFTWTQRTSEVWTTPEFRAPVIAFLRDFATERDLTGRNWIASVASVEVREHILNGANMNVPLPKTPNWPADVPDPVRAGLASLVIRVRNRFNGKVYEHGIPFLDRIDTLPAALAAVLVNMALVFDTLARMDGP